MTNNCWLRWGMLIGMKIQCNVDSNSYSPTVTAYMLSCHTPARECRRYGSLSGHLRSAWRSPPISLSFLRSFQGVFRRFIFLSPLLRIVCTEGTMLSKYVYVWLILLLYYQKRKVKDICYVIDMLVKIWLCKLYLLVVFHHILKLLFNETCSFILPINVKRDFTQ